MRLFSPPLRPALRTCVVVALLFGGTLALFTRVTGYGFTNYDDPRYVVSNAHIQAGLNWGTVKWAFTARTELWQPLTWLSHALDWQWYADNATGHHLTSVLWHSLNAALAFLVFRRLADGWRTSAFAAALFAWHPLRVESVAWVSERKDVMSGCFFLLTLLAYLAYAEARRESRPHRSRYALALTLFACGLMCKPTVVTLPLLLLALDWWPLRRADRPRASAGAADIQGAKSLPPEKVWRSGWLLVREKIPFFALSLVAGIATIKLQRQMGDFTLPLPLGARLANVPVAMVRYLGKFFWPTQLTVSYPHPGWWPVWAWAGATTIVIALSFVAWRWRSTRPWVLTGWCWFIALLLPTVGILQVGFQSLADRYTYLPMLGWELALLWTLREAVKSDAVRRAAVAVAVAVLLGFGMRTWEQEAVWHDPVTLFRHAVAVSADNAVAEGFLGYTLAGMGDAAEAEQHARRALALDPQNEMVVFTLADLDERQGKLDEAMAGYRRALELRPDDARSRYRLSLVLLLRGRVEEATAELKAAAKLEPSIVNENLAAADFNVRSGNNRRAGLCFHAATLLDPNNARAYFGEGMALEQLGSDRDAAERLTRAVQLDPNLTSGHIELGLILLNHHEPTAALPHLEAAVTSHPHLARASVSLARAEEQIGRTADATAHFQQALRDAPDDSGVVRAWAETLARRHQFSDALPFYERAVQLRPDDAQNHAGLGYMFFLTGQQSDAIAQWKEALRLDPKFPGLRERLEKAEGR